MRSIQSASNESKQQVGEIYGERISVHEFQNLVDEYAEVVKFTSGNSALNDQQLPNCATKFGTHTSTTNSSSTKLKSWDWPSLTQKSNPSFRKATAPYWCKHLSATNKLAVSMPMSWRNSWPIMKHENQKRTDAGRIHWTTITVSTNSGCSLKRPSVRKVLRKNTKYCWAKRC